MKMRAEKTLETQAIVLGEKLAEKELECDNLRTANEKLAAERDHALEEIKCLRSERVLDLNPVTASQKVPKACQDPFKTLQQQLESICSDTGETKIESWRAILDSIEKFECTVRERVAQQNVGRGFQKSGEMKECMNMKPLRIKGQLTSQCSSFQPKEEGAKFKKSEADLDSPAHDVESLSSCRKKEDSETMVCCKIEAEQSSYYTSQNHPTRDAASRTAAMDAELVLLKTEKEDMNKKIIELANEVNCQKEYVLQVHEASNMLSKQLHEHHEDITRLLAERESLRATIQKFRKLELNIRSMIQKHATCESRDVDGLVDDLQTFQTMIEKHIKLTGTFQELNDWYKTTGNKQNPSHVPLMQHCKDLEEVARVSCEKISCLEREMVSNHSQLVQAMQQHSDLAKSFRELKDQKDEALLSLQHDLNEYKKKVEDTKSIAEKFHSRLLKVEIERDQLISRCKVLELELGKMEEDQAAGPLTGSSIAENNIYGEHLHGGSLWDPTATEKPDGNKTDTQHLDKEQCHEGFKLPKDAGEATGCEESIKQSIGCDPGKEISPLQKTQGKLDSSKGDGAPDELSEVKEALDKMLLKNVTLQYTLSAQQEQLHRFEKQEKELKLLLAERLQSSKDNTPGPSDNFVSKPLLLQDNKTPVTSDEMNACSGNSGDAASVLPREDYYVDCYGKNQQSAVSLPPNDESAIRISNSCSDALAVSDVPMQENTGNLFQQNSGKKQALRKNLMRILSLSSSKANKQLSLMQSEKKRSHSRLVQRREEIVKLKDGFP